MNEDALASPAAIRQAAALPYRFRANERCEVLLVTTRRRRRWILPRGTVDRPFSPSKAAAKEAFEEAGVGGVIAEDVIDAYRYFKERSDGSADPMSIAVFALAVDIENEDWPESAERQRRWFDVRGAAQEVDEPELRAILLSFARASRRMRSRRQLRLIH